jgi:glyoxylase-like metal-dependent hydrolase (beta-lactamase superfamily II)
MQIKLFVFNEISENTYLLFDETKEAARIDCGASKPEEYRELRDYIQRHDLHLKVLLDTHLHFDHILGNRFVYDTYGIAPQYHEAEAQMPDLLRQAEAFGIELGYTPVSAERFLCDGDHIRFGNTSLQALATPGHSPGGLSFYCAEEHCVFTGDALFRHDIGRTDLWGGDEDTLIRSIQSKLLTLPGETIIYPGHGPASTVSEEKQHNPYI